MEWLRFILILIAIIALIISIVIIIYWFYDVIKSNKNSEKYIGQHCINCYFYEKRVTDKYSTNYGYCNNCSKFYNNLYRDKRDGL